MIGTLASTPQETFELEQVRDQSVREHLHRAHVGVHHTPQQPGSQVGSPHELGPALRRCIASIIERHPTEEPRILPGGTLPVFERDVRVARMCAPDGVPVESVIHKHARRERAQEVVQIVIEVRAEDVPHLADEAERGERDLPSVPVPEVEGADRVRRLYVSGEFRNDPLKSKVSAEPSVRIRQEHTPQDLVFPGDQLLSQLEEPSRLEEAQHVRREAIELRENVPTDPVVGECDTAPQAVDDRHDPGQLFGTEVRLRVLPQLEREPGSCPRHYEVAKPQCLGHSRRDLDISRVPDELTNGDAERRPISSRAQLQDDVSAVPPSAEGDGEIFDRRGPRSIAVLNNET